MGNEFGDMDEVAFDFCDWWSERYLHFTLQMININRNARIQYSFNVYHAAKTLFGHDDFVHFDTGEE